MEAKEAVRALLDRLDALQQVESVALLRGARDFAKWRSEQGIK